MKEKKLCAEPGCAAPSRSRGFCNPHYHDARRAGIVPRRTLEDRLWARIDKRGPDECWPWMGSLSKRGYPNQFQIGDRAEQGHRASYIILVGPIPAGLELDHLCYNPRCVNPNHLEPVTPLENKRRMWARRRVDMVNPNATHCGQGHPFDEENTYRPPNKPNQRQCKACNREAVARYKAKRSAA